MRYRGFLITTCEDSGIERSCANQKGTEICEGYFCQIYSGQDNSYGTALDHFCLAIGHEILDGSQEALEQGVIDYVDNAYENLKETQAELLCQQRSQHWKALTQWLDQNGNHGQLYAALSEQLHMEDDEIFALGFPSLVPYFQKEDYAHTIVDALIETGTEKTTTGHWEVPFTDINRQYAVNLPEDKELLEAISRQLYDGSDCIADFELTSTGIRLDFYYKLCPHYEENMEKKSSLSEGKQDSVRRMNTMAQNTRSEFLEKINRCFLEYREGWMQLDKEELIGQAEKIAAIQQIAKKLPEQTSEEQMAYLLRFKNPLEVVTDSWLDINGSDAVIIDDDLEYILWKIEDTGDEESIYEMETEEEIRQML